MELKTRALRSGDRYAYQSWESFAFGKFTERCTVRNGEYRFEVSREFGSRDWVLRGIQDSREPSEAKDVYAVASEDCRNYLANLTSAYLIHDRVPLSRVEALSTVGLRPAPVERPRPTRAARRRVHL